MKPVVRWRRSQDIDGWMVYVGLLNPLTISRETIEDRWEFCEKSIIQVIDWMKLSTP